MVSYFGVGYVVLICGKSLRVMVIFLIHKFNVFGYCFLVLLL
jgi:hypothetical protein